MIQIDGKPYKVHRYTKSKTVATRYAKIEREKGYGVRVKPIPKTGFHPSNVKYVVYRTLNKIK